MDLIDKKIIKELSNDSRLSMSELGRRIHLSSPAVKEFGMSIFLYGLVAV